jgi:predicted metal-dependent phosphoesterase TrpH
LDDVVLENTLKKLQAARNSRNPRIIERLNALGIDLSLEDLHAEFKEGQLGRPHIAQLMVKKGYVNSIDEAFDNYIGSNKPAYIDKFRLECSEAIATIQGAGGFAVLAHPSLLKSDNTSRVEDLVVYLKEMGLRGLEVYYPGHSPEETSHYLEMAKRHGLLMTGGTDFHGDINPEIEMGYGNGTFHVPYELYENIIKHHRQSMALSTHLSV